MRVDYYTRCFVLFSVLFCQFVLANAGNFASSSSVVPSRFDRSGGAVSGIDRNIQLPIESTQQSVLSSVPKKIVVLGGDGFCGWPTSLHLSRIGHKVTIIDNLSRRNIDDLLGCDSLTPIQPMNTRIRAWKERTGKDIHFEMIDIANDYEGLLNFLKNESPDTIVHFAEQRAAPYSMRSSKTKRYTMDNNVRATHNLLTALVESGLQNKTHVIHLGTMGVYGYESAGSEIPEGYLDVVVEKTGQRRKILYPASPGSVYHTTKCLDALIFQFYNKNDAIKITDLHQGIVWGTNTADTLLDDRLINRFDYDGDYGTVLNRFLMQAALGIPLTVYGSGGQTRAFIHIQDTCKCIELAVNNPPAANAPVQILNQVAETKNIGWIAQLLSSRLRGIKINHLQNPRKEEDRNELAVSNKNFRALGWSPIMLDQALMSEVSDIASKYSYRCIRDKVLPTAYWTREQQDKCKSNHI